MMCIISMIKMWTLISLQLCIQCINNDSLEVILSAGLQKTAQVKYGKKTRSDAVDDVGWTKGLQCSWSVRCSPWHLLFPFGGGLWSTALFFVKSDSLSLSRKDTVLRLRLTSASGSALELAVTTVAAMIALLQHCLAIFIERRAFINKFCPLF